jgi:hypothetical protein
MSEKLRVSCKQINLFGPLRRPSIGGCPRAWGFAYLDRLKLEWPPPHLVDGIKFHAVCQSLVDTDRMPEPQELQPGVVLTPEDVLPEGHFGRMARAALVFMPRRSWADEAAARKHGLGWRTEGEMLFPWTTDRGVVCEIDLRPDLYSDNVGEMIFVDWKSTSNKRYALKSLENDVQANVYAYGLMHTFGKIETRARWVYADKKTYASWPVDGVFGLSKTAEWMHENIDATLELIQTFREAKLAALDLPADIEMCGGTGRFCDNKDRCLTTPTGPAGPRLISLDEIVRYKEGKP